MSKEISEGRRLSADVQQGQRRRGQGQRQAPAGRDRGLRQGGWLRHRRDVLRRGGERRGSRQRSSWLRRDARGLMSNGARRSSSRAPTVSPAISWCNSPATTCSRRKGFRSSRLARRLLRRGHSDRLWCVRFSGRSPSSRRRRPSPSWRRRAGASGSPPAEGRGPQEPCGGARRSSRWRATGAQEAQGRAVEPAGHLRRARRARLCQRARQAVPPEVRRRHAGCTGALAKQGAGLGYRAS